MALTIESINPLEHQEELKQLFLDHDVPHYPAFLDRAYPIAIPAGGRSWVGRDGGGRIVMHMARFPQQFSIGGKRVTGGLLVNMMVHRDHRTFFPAVSMARRAVADSKSSSQVDFLYTNPNDGGGAIVKSGGLKVVATLQRFILPLRGDSWATDIAARGYRLLRRLTAPGRELPFQAHDARHFRIDPFVGPMRDDVVTAYHPIGQYVSWLADYPTDNDLWFTYGPDPDHPTAAVLVRREADAIYRLLVVRRPAGVNLGSLLWPIIGTLRRTGCRRLQVWALAESSFAAEIRGAGFVPRADAQPFLVLPLTAAGAEAVKALPNWEITDFDCDR
jgi:hypothetical protein